MKSFADTLILKSVTMTLDPMTSSMQRLDANGNVCGLVKVILPNPGVSFEGNVIGEADYKTSEYWCYLSPGTRFLKIKYPNLEPLMIDFSEYFVKGIQGKRIYEISLIVPSMMNKTGIPIEVKFESERSAPYICSDDYSSSYFRKRNPKWRFGNDTIGNVQVFLNLKNNKSDQLTTISSKQRLIGNVSKGDVLTLIPENKTYNPLNITVEDSVIEKQHLSVYFKKKRQTFHGHVFDEYNNSPIKDAEIQLYYLNKSEDYVNMFDRSIKDALCSTAQSKESGYFGFRNCVPDYTYYIEVSPPVGYHRRYWYFRNGINLKPNESDSLKIILSPICISGLVTDGKNPIKKAKIEYDALYDDQTVTLDDGNFNIIGIKDKMITVSASGFKTIKLDISDFLSHAKDLEYDKIHNRTPIKKPILIKLQKGDSSVIENGVYEYYKEKIRKLK